MRKLERSLVYINPQSRGGIAQLDIRQGVTKCVTGQRQTLSPAR